MNLIRFCIVFSLHSARLDQVIVSAVLAEFELTLNKYKQKSSEYMESEGVRERGTVTVTEGNYSHSY